MEPTEISRLMTRERPERRAVMRQRWSDLLFLHWSYPVEEIQKTLPAGLRVDAWEGKAWVGLIPFFMSGVRPVGFPAVPGVSSFMEMNLRTYVYDLETGTPGVWFYSLDAAQWQAVEVARRWYHLPYFHAEMSAERTNNAILYQSQRINAPAHLVCRFNYVPQGKPFEAETDTQAFFFAERYVFFTQHRQERRMLRGRVWHTPYPLQQVLCPTWDTNAFLLNGLRAPDGPPESMLYSSGVDVQAYPLD